MSFILIDTCAWIDFLRYPEGELGNKVAIFIENEQAAMCGVIAAELLQGAKSEKQKNQIELLINTVAYLEMQEFDWMNAGKLLQTLRAQGITLPLTDTLIAVVAQRHQVSVLTIDKHFQHLSVKLF